MFITPGQPIRFLLAYLEVDYEDKRYSLAEPPHSRDEWLADKPNLGLDFPNVRNLKLSLLVR